MRAGRSLYPVKRKNAFVVSWRSNAKIFYLYRHEKQFANNGAVEASGDLNNKKLFPLSDLKKNLQRFFSYRIEQAIFEQMEGNYILCACRSGTVATAPEASKKHSTQKEDI